MVHRIRSQCVRTRTLIVTRAASSFLTVHGASYRLRSLRLTPHSAQRVRLSKLYIIDARYGTVTVRGDAYEAKDA